MVSAVLVVDDSAVARALGARKLRDLGFDVTAVASATEARAVQGNARHFRAALLDLELEDGLGTDLARALQATQPGLPVAFLTASTRGAALDDAKGIGPVFLKLSGVEDAISWVESVAGGRALGGATET